MSLLKIGDDPIWKKVSQTMANMRTSRITETMTDLQLSQASIAQRKTEIEMTLSAIVEKKASSAWQAALDGDDGALESRDQLRKEYQSLEEKERFNNAAIEEGSQAVDAIIGKASLQVCEELQPQYNKDVSPEVRTGARALLKAMTTDEHYVDSISRCGARPGYLKRISFPIVLTRESLELLLKQVDELE